MTDSVGTICTEAENKSQSSPPTSEAVREVLLRLISRVPPKPLVRPPPPPSRGPSAKDLFIGFLTVESERGNDPLWVACLAPEDIRQDVQLSPAHPEESASLLPEDVEVLEIAVVAGKALG